MANSASDAFLSPLPSSGKTVDGTPEDTPITSYHTPLPSALKEERDAPVSEPVVPLKEDSDNIEKGQSGTSGEGMFGKMKKSHNNVSSRRTRKKSSATKTSLSTSSVNTDELDDSLNKTARRIVKATPPPTADGSAGEDRIPSPEENEDQSEKPDAAGRFIPPAKAPSIEEEEQRELSEKWRKERLDATVAIRKENKEKDLDQRRKSTPVASGERQDGSSEGESKDSSKPLPAILSVETKFPEHKRSVETASLPESEEPSEKKYKIDKSKPLDGESDAEIEKGKSAEGWAGLGGWVKAAVPAVAVVAIVTIIAVKVLRKR